ncbi:MAG TPA: 2-isopropylmalate synthase [Dehalococcoidia bacterium]|nr:2-isopropylmalate synthase [Dehalococcoidia bacterium]
MSDRIIIFDTTLRDGEQAAGVALNGEEKMEIARQLEKLGVDVIEAGFAASSPGDFDAVAAIAREIKGATVASLARAVPGDVDAAWEALRNAAEKPRIHVFLSSSDIHIMHQLQKDYEQVLNQAVEMVARAKSYTGDVEFSPMDATRSRPEYVWKMLEACIAAGATTVNIPDTVGYAIPDEFERFIRGIFENVKNIDKAVVSVHCHNDLGLSTANSLAALRAGARQIEVCVNGIGERAGNAALEEVVMAIKTREDHLNSVMGIDTTQLYRTSKLVEHLTGMPVQHNKAVVGKNAFRHQSGIHQDGILKLRATYEIMDPKAIGVPEGTQLVLGKLSGRHALQQRLEDLGYKLDNEALSRAFMAFKELADKKGEVDDRDLEALVMDEKRVASEVFHLVWVQVQSGSSMTATGTVRIRMPDGDEVTDAAIGDGPVDAVFKAILRITGISAELVDYQVKSVTEGTDAQGEVVVRVKSGDHIATGRGADTDIIVASAKAYLDGLSRVGHMAKVAGRVATASTP